MFMEWRTPGSPSELEIDGKLVTKASLVAKNLNGFFTGKVKGIRDAIVNVPANYFHCQRIMDGKDCSLS